MGPYHTVFQPAVIYNLLNGVLSSRSLMNTAICPLCGSQDIRFKGFRLPVPQRWNPDLSMIDSAIRVLQCSNCLLIFPEYIPAKDLKKLYEYVDAEEYFRNSLRVLTRRFYKRLYGWLLTIGFRRGWHVLEVGSGTGIWLKMFVELGAKVVGIEFARNFIDFAVNAQGVDPNLIMEADIETVELPAGEFDLVIAHQILEHLRDPFGVWDKLVNALRPGGFIYVVVPCAEWKVASLIDLYYKVRFKKPLTTHLSPLHPPFHLYEFSGRSLKLMCSRNGVHVISLKQIREAMIEPPLGWAVTLTNFVLNTGIEWELVGMKAIW